jgi:hypothetical protein
MLSVKTSYWCGGAQAQCCEGGTGLVSGPADAARKPVAIKLVGSSATNDIDGGSRKREGRVPSETAEQGDRDRRGKNARLIAKTLEIGGYASSR